MRVDFPAIDNLDHNGRSLEQAAVGCENGAWLRPPWYLFIRGGVLYTVPLIYHGQVYVGLFPAYLQRVAKRTY
jgi:hypothetical protein